VHAACNTPCDRLDARASSCKSAPGRYVDDSRSVCTATREELGTATFDPFAECVLDSACDDIDAIAVCRDEHVEVEITPCLDFELWASACGLEPIGTENDCETLARNFGEIGFAEWVACVTKEGCPIADDPRYDRCQEIILPPGGAGLIDACVIVSGWTTECAGGAPDYFPVVETSVAACLVEAEPFVAESYLEYARCLEQAACDDVTARVDCLLLLQLTDPSQAAGDCQRLVAYAESCLSSIGGGSVDVCARLFARFTPSSLASYVDCVTAAACDDAAASLACTALLDIQ
jgi:hypothetical protein